MTHEWLVDHCLVRYTAAKPVTGHLPRQTYIAHVGMNVLPAVPLTKLSSTVAAED